MQGTQISGPKPDYPVNKNRAYPWAVEFVVRTRDCSTISLVGHISTILKHRHKLVQSAMLLLTYTRTNIIWYP